MDIEILLKEKIIASFQKLGISLTLTDVVIENSKDKAHGDYASNVALKYSRLLQKNPRDAASIIIENLDMEGIDKIEIAGPGFINFFMKHDSLQSVVKTIIEKCDEYGRGENKNLKIKVFNPKIKRNNPTKKRIVFRSFFLSLYENS